MNRAQYCRSARADQPAPYLNGFLGIRSSAIAAS
jgi:hypothetical protein